MTSIDPASRFRVAGPLMSLAEAVKTKPIRVMQMSAAQIQEDKLYQEQTRVREEAINRYAASHPDNIYGQVVVDGKLFATVYDSGRAATRHSVSMTDAGKGEDLARARLADIARTVKGEIRYSNFLPDFGGRGCTIPDDVYETFPKVTARPLGGFLDELEAAAGQARLDRARGDGSKVQ